MKNRNVNISSVACSGTFLWNTPQTYDYKQFLKCDYCGGVSNTNKCHCQNCGAPNDNFAGYGWSDSGLRG